MTPSIPTDVQLFNFVDDLEASLGFDPGSRYDCDNIILCGVGGSAVSSDFATDCCLVDSVKPIRLIKYPDLPSWASDRTLAVISSYSGNTAELTDIVLYASQNNMPLVAITRNADSFLGKHSDHLLLQPQLHEACPLDCAPTTSTTVQMALGDALAMCLLTARGFRKEDFHRFHPGGSLGQKLSLVRDIMHTGAAMPLLHPDAPMMDVLAEMTRKGFGCVGVMDGETLVGIITDGDLRRHMGPNILESTASELMTRNPVCVGADMLSAKAQGIMEERKITCVFVVDEQRRPLGVLSMHDILQS